jgi:hypothetical protein
MTIDTWRGARRRWRYVNVMRPLRVVEVLAICGCKRRGESCRFKLQEVGGENDRK